MEFQESRTYANLMSAFAGESQARVKYLAYAEKARQEGYEQIGAVFQETSDNEQAHANLWLGYLYGGQLPDTLHNLQNGVEGEHFEWSEMYREYAEIARAEGYEQIAAAFELVASVEHSHEQRYQALHQRVEGKAVFQRSEKQVWVCRYCGYIHTGEKAPGICPLCKKPQGFFQIKAEQF